MENKQTMKYLKSLFEKTSYFFIDKIFNDKKKNIIFSEFNLLIQLKITREYYEI